MQFRLALPLVALLSLYAVATARAFSQPAYYPRPAAMGGGGGRWFTGSPSDGYACSTCHTGGKAFPLTIEGLPLSGYQPGMQYQLRISWPEFSARAELLKLQAPAPAGMPAATTTAGVQVAGPDTSLVAELTTETGLGAGAIELEYADIDSPARSEEWCEHLEGVPAGQLFDTASADPAAPVGHCEGAAPGDRCVLATQVCGAKALRFRWTAPAQAVGPIWFTAGFVATDRLNADPLADGVFEVAQPLLPAGSASQVYVAEVSSGCDAAPSIAGQRVPAWLLLVLCSAGIRACRARRGATWVNRLWRN